MIRVVTSLYQYRDNEYSQEGEDGIIKEINRRLDITEGSFCEFGAWDGKNLSNCYRLLDQESWSGVMIEGDEGKFPELAELAKEHGDSLQAFDNFVEPKGDDSLEKILDQSFLETNFDLLSIDVDGSDYYIWKYLEKYTPKVVLIEYNQCLGPDIRYASDLTEYHVELSTERTDADVINTRTDPTRGWGSSFKSLVELGEEKGYTLVTATRLNLVFLDNQFVDAIGESVEQPHHYFRSEWPVDYCDPVNRSVADEVKSRILNLFMSE